jgi:hypothetical protein
MTAVLLLALQLSTATAHAIADELRNHADRVRSACGDQLGEPLERIADRLDEESGANQACDREDGFPVTPPFIYQLPAPTAHAIADELRNQADRVRSACGDQLGLPIVRIADRLDREAEKENHVPPRRTPRPVPPVQARPPGRALRRARPALHGDHRPTLPRRFAIESGRATRPASIPTKKGALTMPGPRYRHRITAGPFSGRRARIIRQAQDPRYFEVKIHGQENTIATVEAQHLEAIAQKTTRPKP